MNPSTLRRELDRFDPSLPLEQAGCRLGQRAVYAWIHPNLCLNRYGEQLFQQLLRAGYEAGLSPGTSAPRSGAHIS